MAHLTLYGIVPPIITPMNADESVNIPELRRQIERQIAGGVHGIFCFGTNGEGYILSMKEKEEILEATIDQVAGRVPVYAGTGCISTADTVYMSRRAEEMGADVLSIITPSFALASQEELYRHYVEVAKHVNIPIVLYNIPPRTGNKLLPETVARLARDVDVICGAKDSSGDIENLKAFIRVGEELRRKRRRDPHRSARGRRGRHCRKSQSLSQDCRRDLRQLCRRRHRARRGMPAAYLDAPARVQIRQPQHNHQKGRQPARLPGRRVPPPVQLPVRRGRRRAESGAEGKRRARSLLRRKRHEHSQKADPRHHDG